jgi:hypothetical protein
MLTKNASALPVLLEGVEHGMSWILNTTAEHLNTFLGSAITDFTAIKLFGNYVQVADICTVHCALE